MPPNRFHVCHVIPPDRRFHGLNGYREQADAVVWGLQALGYQATYAINSTRTDAINIVMGDQMLDDAQINALPRNTVVYNFEQMVKVPREGIKRTTAAVAERFTIWDYCEANLEQWKQFGAARAHYVMIGWAPILERVPRPTRQDIDVLIYGLPGGERLPLFQALCKEGITSVFVCGLYGAERDALIARSKIIVNCALYTGTRIFEIARVSYLLGNAKTVVSLLHPETIVEPDIHEAVRFSPPETIIDDCLALLKDDSRRAALEEKARATMRTRDIREILRGAIAKLPKQS